VRAVDDVSFSLPPGGALGLVGESGSGKSTLSRLICRLLDTDAGNIIFRGESISAIPARVFHRAPQRRELQIVFQDPNDSLNPRYTAFDCIAHPLRRLERLRGAQLTERVREAASRAGLPASLLERFPHQLSGGQKARIGIARAIAPRPRLLVLDEPTAALAPRRVAEAFARIQNLPNFGVSVLVVEQRARQCLAISDRGYILDGGQVALSGTADGLLKDERAAELYLGRGHVAQRA
jgi:peptide/nickel transport system ATP-binding protein